MNDSKWDEMTSSHFEAGLGEPLHSRSREKIIGPEYYSNYGNSQVGKGAVDRFKVR